MRRAVLNNIVVGLVLLGVVLVVAFSLGIAGVVQSNENKRAIEALSSGGGGSSSSDVAIVPPNTVCTYSAATIQALNSTCPSVTLYNDTRLFSVCLNRTFQRLNTQCWLSSCLTNLTTIVSSSPPSYFSSYHVGAITFRSLVLNETTAPGRIPDMYAKFFASNQPAAGEAPFIGNITNLSPVAFNDTDFATRNYTVFGGAYARTIIAMTINVLGNQRLAERGAQSRFVYNLRYTPATCPNATVRAIPWLTQSSSRVASVLSAATAIYRLREYYTSPQFNVSMWDTECPLRVTDNSDQAVAVTFCKAFPNFYAFPSLVTPTLVPSPYRDLEFLARLYMEEFESCGAPRGCIGYVVGTL